MIAALNSCFTDDQRSNFYCELQMNRRKATRVYHTNIRYDLYTVTVFKPCLEF